MKTLSIALVVLTTAHAAMTADATALIAASFLFARECGKDVNRMWNKLITGDHDTDGR